MDEPQMYRVPGAQFYTMGKDGALKSLSGEQPPATKLSWPPNCHKFEVALPKGAHVCVHGLKAKPELNGCAGIILGECKEERLPVRVFLDVLGRAHVDVRVRSVNIRAVTVINDCRELIAWHKLYKDDKAYMQSLWFPEGVQDPSSCVTPKDLDLLVRKNSHHIIGYWKDEGDPKCTFPLPEAHIEWSCVEAKEVVVHQVGILMNCTYPAHGLPFWIKKEDYSGVSTCRICGCSNGNIEYIGVVRDVGSFCLPSGYMHYIYYHNVSPNIEELQFLAAASDCISRSLHLPAATDCNPTAES